MKTVNQTVGCEPFPKKGIQEAKTAAGLSFIANTTTMVGLKVVVGNDTIPSGCTVYVSGKDYVQGWAKTAYKLDVPLRENLLGQAIQKAETVEIILVPQSAILVVDL